MRFIQAPPRNPERVAEGLRTSFEHIHSELQPQSKLNAARTTSAKNRIAHTNIRCRRDRKIADMSPRNGINARGELS